MAVQPQSARDASDRSQTRFGGDIGRRASCVDADLERKTGDRSAILASDQCSHGIESFRANLKRGCNSAYHQMSAKHLHRHVGVSLRAQGSAAVLESLDAWQMSNIYE